MPDLTEFSEAVQTEELLNECEEKFAQLQMVTTFEALLPLFLTSLATYMLSMQSTDNYCEI